MSGTVDANILLYASDSGSDVHEQAVEFLARRAAGPELFYLFWPTVMAYLRVATHPAVFERPLEPAKAQRNIDRLLALSHVRTPGEPDGFWKSYSEVTREVVVRANLVPDAHLVALMQRFGVDTIWTRDSDFRKFPGIRVENPFA